MDLELSMQGLDRRLGSFLRMVIFLNVINLFPLRFVVFLTGAGTFSLSSSSGIS
jgi:hypothetical protein